MYIHVCTYMYNTTCQWCKYPGICGIYPTWKWQIPPTPENGWDIPPRRRTQISRGFRARLSVGQLSTFSVQKLPFSFNFEHHLLKISPQALQRGPLAAPLPPQPRLTHVCEIWEACCGVKIWQTYEKSQSIFAHPTAPAGRKNYLPSSPGIFTSLLTNLVIDIN